MLPNRTVNTELLLVAITRRRAVVDCHVVLFLVARQHACSNRILYCGHSTQYSHLVSPVIVCLKSMNTLVSRDVA